MTSELGSRTVAASMTLVLIVVAASSVGLEEVVEVGVRKHRQRYTHQMPGRQSGKWQHKQR